MKSDGQGVKVSVALAFLLGAAAWLGRPLMPRGQGQSQGAAMPGGGLSTPWRPNKPFEEARYVGAEACAECHTDESAAQHATPMGRALERPAESPVLASNPRLTFRSGPYTYQIVRQGREIVYTVTDGTRTISEPILYAFGQGKAGQTYLLRRGDSFYESRVSFYKEIGGLDWTIGYTREPPPTLEEALGRAVSADEARSCFGCHATAAVAGQRLQLERLMPGVTCEACHGPGGEHVAAMRAKKPGEKLSDMRIFNPGEMSPDELTQEFCGSCHRSAETVLTLGLQKGLNNVRFQPYRLFSSRGHDPDDRRMSCVACHNPHENLQHDAAYYDSKCFACHQSGAALKSPRAARAEAAEGRDARPCPVAAKGCASCHMPKVDLPGAHFRFTDHRIRIARPGEPYPN